MYSDDSLWKRGELPVCIGGKMGLKDDPERLSSDGAEPRFVAVASLKNAKIEVGLQRPAHR